MSKPAALPPFSRRSFLQVSSAALACHFMHEALLAQDASGLHSTYPDGAVRINANENPLGPCTAARDAVAAAAALGGRYHFNLTDDLINTFIQQQGLKRENVMAYAGSTPGLYYTVAAFSSPKASYVTAEPGYEAGAGAAKAGGARVINVPLTKTDRKSTRLNSSHSR